MRIKIFALALTLSLFAGLSLTACDKNPGAPPDSEKKSIVCSIFPQYDIARRIAGDKFNVSLLMKNSADIHTYEPTPADVLKVRESALFVRVGGVDDVWQNYNNNSGNVIMIMHCVDTYEETIVPGMQEEAEEGSGPGADAEYDEHVWMNPNNMVKIAETIRDAIIALDETGRDFYTDNCREYIDELKALDEEIRNALENRVRDILVFGDRFPFRYFTEEYGLDYYAAFPGCSTETDASAVTLAFLIDKVNEEKIPAVYYIENGTEKIARTIAAETGAEVLLLNSCHSVTGEELNTGIGYIDLMRRNINEITKGVG